MVQIDSYEDEKKFNMMIAKTHAEFAKKGQEGDDIDIPMEMMDTRAMAEFYAELLSYGPSILKDAVHQGDVFERFKLTLKFAFSILYLETF